MVYIVLILVSCLKKTTLAFVHLHPEPCALSLVPCTFIFMEIKFAKYLISNADYKQCPKPDRSEYAFIGRSNVGKSSLINMLCNNSKLAKISSTPGKTQLINHFEIFSSPSTFGRQRLAIGRRRLAEGDAGGGKGEAWYLVDLPGYGYAATVSQKQRRNWSLMIEEYIRKRKNLACLFVLIDGRQKPQIADIEFINKLGEWRVPFVLLFTKSDKNKPGETENHIKAFIQALIQTWEKIPRCFIVSSITKTGRRALLEYISGLNQRFKSGSRE